MDEVEKQRIMITPNMKDWKWYINRLNDIHMAECTPELKIHWLKSLKFLEGELPKGFLKTCIREHPLFIKINNAANGAISAIKSLVCMVDTLKELKDDVGSNYHKLLSKLYAEGKCRTEGLPFIEISETVLKSGLKLRFPDEIDKQKNPDIEVFDPETGDTFYIEVAKLNDSDKVTASGESYGQFLEYFPLNDVWISCYQVRNFTIHEMDSVVSSIKTVMNRALLDNGLVYCKSDDIELAVVPLSKRNELEDWCTLHSKSTSSNLL